MSCGYIVVVHGLTSSHAVVDYPHVVIACRREKVERMCMFSRIDGEYHWSRCVTTKRMSYK
jgi:hypothetical protein